MEEGERGTGRPSDEPIARPAILEPGYVSGALERATGDGEGRPSFVDALDEVTADHQAVLAALAK